MFTGKMNAMKHGKFETGLVHSYLFPAEHQLQQDNYLNMQNISAFYLNLMESVGGKHSHSQWISILLKVVRLFNIVFKNHVQPANSEAYEQN